MLLRVLPLLRQRPAPVIIASTWEHLIGLVRLRRFIRASILCCAHGTDVTRALSVPAETRRMLGVLSRVGRFIPVSHFLANQITSLRPDLTAKTVVVHNGVDTGHYKPWSERALARSRYGLSPASRVLLSVGRIIEVKGFRQILLAMPAIIQKAPDTMLLIAGLPKEPEYGILLALIDELNLKASVRFLKVVMADELPALYNCANIFILASHPVHHPFYQEDNLPMVLLEANACGVPIIASRCGGFAEIVRDGVNGFIVPAKDPAAIADKTIQLLDNPALRHTLGAQGRDLMVREFSNEKMVERFLEVVQGFPPA
jgi:glycosyltransferase involved in cell wall biosynthesis